MNPKRGARGTRVKVVDVAERAGVSPATVSRSLPGLAKVAPETRQRVLDAARDLSFVASLGAAGRPTGSRPSVAVIVPFITRWFFSTVTAGHRRQSAHPHEVLGDPASRVVPRFGAAPASSPSATTRRAGCCHPTVR